MAKAPEESLLLSNRDLSRIDSARNFAPSFERFLQVSFENYRDGFNSTAQQQKAPEEPKTTAAPISDFTIAPPKNVLFPSKFQTEHAQVSRNPRTLILNESRDSTFDSDVESDNKVERELLQKVSNASAVEIEAAPVISFLEQPGKVDGLEGISFDMRQLLEILSEKGIDSRKTTFEYTCKYCGQGFRTGCGLGGHVSKVHGGLKAKQKKKRILKDFKHFDKERSRFFRRLKK